MEHLAINGGNLVVEDETSVIEGETAHTQWCSAAIIHYTGNGLWSIGLIPVDHSKWEWIQTPIGRVSELLADVKFRICPTEKITERLRET